MKYEKDKTCCFIGHRHIAETDELKTSLYMVLTDLIENKGITNFLFGSKSNFDKLCLNIISELKLKSPFLNRVYVRAEFEHISEDYRNYILEQYDDTYYPSRIKNSGKAAYVERNHEMIDKSEICVFYYDKNYLPTRRKSSTKNSFDYQPNSGTKIAYEYAIKKHKETINMFHQKIT